MAINQNSVTTSLLLPLGISPEFLPKTTKWYYGINNSGISNFRFLCGCWNQIQLDHWSLQLIPNSSNSSEHLRISLLQSYCRSGCEGLFVIPRTIAHQAPQSMRFSRQEYESGLPFPSPGDLPDPGIKPQSPELWADSFLSEQPGKPQEGEHICILTLHIVVQQKPTHPCKAIILQLKKNNIEEKNSLLTKTHLFISLFP